MHTFIIDHFACQRAHKRFLWNTITGLGWAFWIYLWLPLLHAIGMLLVPHHEQATTEAFHSIQELFTTLTTHLSMTVLMIAAFLAWASLQWLVMARRRRTVQKQPIIRLHRVLQFMPDEQHVNTWRQAQRMVVVHDEESGLIQQVDIL
ncbi:MAG: Poly-beta-1,6-N-acetyl-D-glucosamine biosynthesis protein PgaD [Candidatus Brocadiaceae bacterium]|nr:Poly-beta-1,6-N-acetyl-D-glucosamine biosynthesis protein PgaD [Candidatus Brocadiaceae bacterium]